MANYLYEPDHIPERAEAYATRGEVPDVERGARPRRANSCGAAGSTSCRPRNAASDVGVRCVGRGRLLGTEGTLAVGTTEGGLDEEPCADE